MKLSRVPIVFTFLLVFAALFGAYCLFCPLAALAQMTMSGPTALVPPGSVPLLQIASVTPDGNSLKIVPVPFAGAGDYRVFDVSNPGTVKYVGIWHLDADQLGQYSKLAFATDSSGNILYPLHTVNVGAYSPLHHIDIPGLELEPNLTVGVHTLIVQAVDKLGPCPPANLYDANNLPLMNAASMAAMGGEGMDTMLGANSGTTPDGLTSTNGQGPSTNVPHVIAQSQPFTVTVGSAPPIPSCAAATGTFFDDFDNGGTFAPVGTPDVILGNESFVMNTAAGAWDVFENHCDLRDSRPFLMNGHYMAVDFDGGSPGSNEPYHVAYSGISLSPQKTADISGGQLLHATTEDDSHTDSRRWPGILVCDASDLLTSLAWPENEQVNKSNTVLSLYIQAGIIQVTEIIGGVRHSITGSGPGSSTYYGPRYLFQGFQYGRGLDDRSRFDLFLSQTHFAVYEDGHKEVEYDLPVPLPFATAKVYYVQYLYHSGLEHDQAAARYETYWINIFGYSDERHWDNMGFETLPASTPWASLAGLIKMPVPQAPVYAPPSVTITPGQAAQIDALTSLVPVNGGSVNLDTLKQLETLLQALLGS